MRSPRTASMGRRLQLAVLLLLTGLSGPLAGTSLAGPSLKLVDVHGRDASPSRYRGRPYLLVVANRVNEPEAYRATIKMTLRHLKNDLQPVVVFDLRTLSRLYHPIARAAMRRTGKRAVNEVTEKAKAQGLEVRPDISEHTHLVPDPNGAAAESVGVDKDADKPTFILLDRKGHEVGRVVGEARLGEISALIDKM